MLLRKFFTVVIVSMVGFAHNTIPMQVLIADFYNKRNSKDKPKYSINLMLINERLKKDQKFIHPSNDEFASIICKWAVLNKNGVVNVWYDEEMTTLEAIKNTDEAIAKECSQYPEKASVRLKNERKLPEIKDKPGAFSDKMSVYFRADLLRATVGYNHVSQGKVDYFVYSDLDVKPMDENEIFDEITKENLKHYGMVMAKSSRFPEKEGFENSFQILSNHKPNLLQAQKTAVIDLNIKRAEETWWFFAQNLDQKVYYSYPYMFKY